MTEIETYIAALKVTWIRRHICTEHIWRQLCDEVILRGKYIWERNSRSVNIIARQVSNPFWKETLQAYACFSASLFFDPHVMSSCSIFYSNESKFKDIEIAQWREKGLQYLNDLINPETGQTYNFGQFKRVFGVQCTYLDYMGMIQSLPREWRILNKTKEMGPLVHPQIAFLIKERRGARMFYDQMLVKKIPK